MGKIQRIQNKTKPKKQKHIQKTFKKQTENVLSLSVSLQNESAAVLTVLELAALQWLDVSRLSPKNLRRISSCTVLSHLHVTNRHHLWHSITWVIARQAQYLTCSDFQPTCPPLNHQKCFRTIVWKLWFRYFSISSSPTPLLGYQEIWPGACRHVMSRNVSGFPDLDGTAATGRWPRRRNGPILCKPWQDFYVPPAWCLSIARRVSRCKQFKGTLSKAGEFQKFSTALWCQVPDPPDVDCRVETVETSQPCEEYLFPSFVLVTSILERNNV